MSDVIRICMMLTLHSDSCTFFEWAEFDEDGEPIWPNDKCK